jgi:hypothetical protein
MNVYSSGDEPMKRWIIALIFVLVYAAGVSAQDATQEAPLTVVETPALTTVYVEVLPAWVLPGYAVLLVVIGFLLYTVYKYGIHLKDMISEKAFASLIGIVRDVAKDIAARTPNKIDDALVKGLLPDEPASTTNTISVNMPGIG